MEREAWSDTGHRQLEMVDTQSPADLPNDGPSPGGPTSQFRYGHPDRRMVASSKSPPGDLRRRAFVMRLRRDPIVWWVA